MDIEKVVLGASDYVIIAVMLLVSASIGIYFKFSGDKQRTMDEYLLAGRNMSILPVAFSLTASSISAVALIGMPADIYRFGIHLSFINFGFMFGAIVVSYVFLPVFFEFQSFTAYGYLERRFGKLSRRVTSLVFVVQMVLYMSVVLYGPAVALSAVTNLSTWVSIISIGVVCTLYCILGGMKAVIWTDVFQALLMYIGLFAVAIKGVLDTGGFKNIYDRALAGGRLDFRSASIDLETRYTMVNVILQGAVMGASMFGSNQMHIQRMITVKSINRIRTAIFVSVLMLISFNLLCGFIGISIYAVYYKCDPITSPRKPISSADQLVPYYMMSIFGNYPGLAGLCICGIFSASLSTISSAVNSLSAVTMEDFIRPVLSARGIVPQRAAFIAKALTLAFGTSCVMLAFLVARFGNLFQAALIVFGMVAGPTLAVFTLGMLTTRANEKGVVFGMLTSIAFSMWWGFSASVYGPKPVALPVSIEGCASLNSSSLSSFINLSFMNDSASSDAISNYDREISHILLNVSSDVPIHITEPVSKYIFPLYRVSYMWISPFSVIIAVVLGYIASVIIDYWRGEKNDVSRDCLSPVVRWMVSEREDEREASIHKNLNSNGDFELSTK